MTTAQRSYALRLSDDELGRYRMMAARARAEEGDLWARAGLVPGARVADVGCGPGAMLVALAEVVGATGHVTGVDADPTAVAAARAALAAARLGGGGVAPGDVRQGRAEATGLRSGSVDTAVLRHVLAHNGGAEQRIVDHLATLVRAGGHVYLLDVDMTTGNVAVPAAEDLQARYLHWHRSRGNDPRIGRRLGGLGRAAGLEVVGAILLVTWGALDLPLVVCILGGLLLACGGAAMLAGVLALRRFAQTVELSATGVTVTSAQGTRTLPWSTVTQVTLNGRVLTLQTGSDRDEPVEVLNPRGPAEATFAALIEALRGRLDADRGYRPLE